MPVWRYQERLVVLPECRMAGRKQNQVQEWQTLVFFHMIVNPHRQKNMQEHYLVEQKPWLQIMQVVWIARPLLYNLVCREPVRQEPAYRILIPQ